MFRPKVSTYPDSATYSFSKELQESLDELSDVKKLAEAKEAINKLLKGENNALEL
jgi:hypothetical protein